MYNGTEEVIKLHKDIIQITHAQSLAFTHLALHELHFYIFYNQSVMYTKYS